MALQLLQRLNDFNTDVNNWTKSKSYLTRGELADDQNRYLKSCLKDYVSHEISESRNYITIIFADDSKAYKPTQHIRSKSHILIGNIV